MHEPDWAPLERVLRIEHCAGFMWMGWAIRPDGPPIAQCKRGITRRYLNLDESGNAYRYVPAPEPTWCGSHVRIRLELAIDAVFEVSSACTAVNTADPRATP
jgi:hypothetical protein